MFIDVGEENRPFTYSNLFEYLEPSVSGPSTLDEDYRLHRRKNKYPSLLFFFFKGGTTRIFGSPMSDNVTDIARKSSPSLVFSSFRERVCRVPHEKEAKDSRDSGTGRF